jgi:hypothetical protein
VVDAGPEAIVALLVGAVVVGGGVEGVIYHF